MKNTFKRITALAISAIFMISVLTACGESATLLPFLDKASDKLDLDGRVVKLNDIVTSQGFDLMGYKETTVLCDALYQGFADIETALNCTIDMDSSISLGLVFAKILSGACDKEIFYGTHNELQELALGGYSVPVTNYLDIVDIKKIMKSTELLLFRNVTPIRVR